jgi:hypothetical protein
MHKPDTDEWPHEPSDDQARALLEACGLSAKHLQEPLQEADLNRTLVALQNALPNPN